MPPVAHKKILIYGALLQAEASAGSEIFEFGMASASTMTDAALAAAVDTFVSGTWNALSSLQIMACAQYQGTRVETYDATGHVVSSFNQPTATPVIGGNTATNCAILSMAITLETGVVDSRGTKVRGRFYPPACATAPVGATVLDTNANSYNTQWGAFVHGLNGVGAAIAVASSTSAGLVPVTGTTCDNVVDTQRRRKNSVSGTRTAVHAV
jgi:hypothetical protein